MRTTKTLFRSSTLVVFTLVFGSVGAWALPIPVLSPFFGELDISNLAGVLVGVSTSVGPQTGCVNFNTAIGGSASPCSAVTATTMNVSGLDPKDFSFPSTGSIKNIPQGTSMISTWEVVPAGTLDGPGPVNFDLTAIPAGVVSGTNDCVSGVVGSTCSPPGSPFVFFQASANQVQIGFVVDANAYTVSNATFTPYVANFQTSISGDLTGFGCTGIHCTDTIPNVLLWEGSGGSIEAGWHATESPSATVPEPFTGALFGMGLVAISLLGRRLRRA